MNGLKSSLKNRRSVKSISKQSGNQLNKKLYLKPNKKSKKKLHQVSWMKESLQKNIQFYQSINKKTKSNQVRQKKTW